MKVLALIYPGMTLLDLVGPLQAWSFSARLRSSVCLASFGARAHGLRPHRTRDEQF